MGKSLPAVVKLVSEISEDLIADFRMTTDMIANTLMRQSKFRNWHVAVRGEGQHYGIEFSTSTIAYWPFLHMQ